MASVKQTNNKVAHLETYVRGQLEQAQKRLGAVEGALEKKAGAALKTLAERGTETRKELEALLAKLDDADLRKLLETAQVKRLGKRATQARNDVRRRLEGLRTSLVEGLGFASQAQMKDLQRELARIARKVDGLGAKKERAEKSSAAA
jgi:hypothetical protein